MVKSIINKCVLCKKLEGRPYGTPPTSQLPGFRLSDEFAFTSIGVDFAGPVYIKDIYHNIGSPSSRHYRQPLRI